MMQKMLLSFILILTTCRYVENHPLVNDGTSSNSSQFEAGFFSKTGITSPLSATNDQICAVEGDVTHYCPGGVCCTPGSPSSRCCPDYRPTCCGIFCCKRSQSCVIGICWG